MVINANIYIITDSQELICAPENTVEGAVTIARNIAKILGRGEQ